MPHGRKNRTGRGDWFKRHRVYPVPHARHLRPIGTSACSTSFSVVLAPLTIGKIILDTLTSGDLRFKTDSSEEGPDKDAPAIVNAGMMGDRASIIFSSPEEISRFIVRE